MPWFEIALTIHLASISSWLAWSTLTGFEGVRTLQSDDVNDFVGFLDGVVRRGQAVYMPIALVALLTWPLAMTLGPSDFSGPEPVLALVLLVTAILLGSSVVGPRSEHLRRYVVAGGRDDSAAESFWQIFWIHHVKLAVLIASASLTVIQLIR